MKVTVYVRQVIEATAWYRFKFGRNRNNKNQYKTIMTFLLADDSRERELAQVQNCPLRVPLVDF